MYHKRLQRRQTLTASAFLLPSLVLLLLFSIIPILFSGYLSFTKYNVLTDPQWIGLSNYTAMAKDPNIRAAIKNTLIFVVVTVPLQTGFALVIAALIAELFRNRFGNLIKAALFIPTVASSATIGAVWCMLCGAKGPVNLLLNTLGLDSVSWLGTKQTAMFLLCFITVWQNIGYFLVIFYAGLMDIPRDLYEAAEIDGASPIQRFFRITLPNLKSVTYLVVTLGTIWAFQSFDLIHIMTNGGPGNGTMTLVLSVYRAAFKESRMGYASAISMVLLICILVVSVLQKLLMHTDGGDAA